MAGHTMATKTVCKILLVGVLIPTLRTFADPLSCYIINYNEQPILSDVAVIEAGPVYDALGLLEPSPVRFTDLGTGQPLPAFLSQHNGVSVFWVFIKLDPLQRIEVVVEPTASWQPITGFYSAGLAGETAILNNGILELVYDSSGIDIAYNSDSSLPQKDLLNNVYFKGWIDNMDRGSIIDPEGLGLTPVNTRSAQIDNALTTFVNDEPTLILNRSFSGIGADMELTETVSLLSGQAAVRYTLVFNNTGSETLYLAWADGSISGNFTNLQRWNQTPYWLDNLFDLYQGGVSHHVKYWYNPPSWCYTAVWPETGSGIGLTTLDLLSGSHYHNKTMWSFNSGSFSLVQVETDRGYLPIEVLPGQTAELGARFTASLPGINAFEQTQSFFEADNQGMTASFDKPYAIFVCDQAIQGSKQGLFAETFDSVDRWINTEGTVSLTASGAKLTVDNQKAEIKCALEMDFQEPHSLCLEIDSISAGALLEIIARPTDNPENPVILVGEATNDEPDPSGLSLHYRFDETTGTTASDEGGINDGNVINGTWDSSGYNGGCLFFDGTTYVQVPDADQMFNDITDQATYSVWVWGDPAYQPYNDAIFYGNDTVSGSQHNPLVYVPASNGNVTFRYGSPDVDEVNWTSSFPQDWRGQWNHYAFTKNTQNGKMYIYCNGSRVAENESAFHPISATTHFTIGGIDRGSYQSLLYHGKLDDFRIYDYELSTSEIQWLADLNTSSPVEITQPGSYIIDFSSLTGWTGSEEFTLEISLVGNASDSITIDSLSIGPAPPEAPALISPADHFDVTDIAVNFSWFSVENVTDYELQWSQDVSFNTYQSQIITSPDDIVSYLPMSLIGTGTWYWRVRGIDPWGQNGSWSETFTMTVNDVHPKAPLIRTINNAHPLFTLEIVKCPDLGLLSESVPEDIRPYTAIVSGNNYGVTQTIYRDYYSAVAGQSNQFLIRGGGPGGQTITLADIEWLFQNYSNIIGICQGELFWDYYQWDETGKKEWKTRLIQLCAKYGRLYIWGDGNGTTFKWQQFASDEYWLPFSRQYSDYLIFSMKNNVNLTMHSSEGALMGMWLSDMIADYGEWCECWYWNDAGFGELDEYLGRKLGNTGDFPRNFYNISFMLGLAQGKLVYNVDGQCTTGTGQAAIWDANGQTSETFNRYIVPFIRGVVEHQVVPEKEAVIEKVKIAVAQSERFENIPHNGEYGVYAPLYEETYGFRADGIWYEYIPNTAQYYFIPLLPYDTADLGPDIHIENLADLDQNSYVESVFDSYYTKEYTGDALVNVVGDSIFIQSTHENSDVNEFYSVDLMQPNIRNISGQIGPHKYIMGTFENNGCNLWIQVNTEYPERNTTFNFQCNWEPIVNITPADAIVTQTWDSVSGQFTLEVSHLNGAVEMELRSGDINEDGYSDFFDLASLFEWWLDTGTGLAGDFNDDQLINLADFASLACCLGATEPVESQVLITEIGTTDDFIEIQNLSPFTTDTNGWMVVVNDSCSGLNIVEEGRWNLPQSMEPRQVLYATDDSGDNYFGSGICWQDAGPGWAVIIDDEGVIRDFAAWGYTESEIDLINTTVDTIPINITQNEWSGDGKSYTDPSHYTYQRTGSVDNNSAIDFTRAASSKGMENAGLNFP